MVAVHGAVAIGVSGQVAVNANHHWQELALRVQAKQADPEAENLLTSSYHCCVVQYSSCKTWKFQNIMLNLS